MTRWICLLAPLTIWCSPMTLHATPPQRVDELDAYIETGLADWKIPGLALAIVKDGEVVLCKGYGERDREQGLPVDEDTLFAIASNSKLFTTTAISMLADEDALSWNDPVIKHVPRFRTADPWMTENLTLEDMVTHRSGLRNSIRAWYGSGFSSQEILNRMPHMEISYRFRDGYHYHNIGYMIASLALENASGRSWGAFVRERIFEPLGMERSLTSESQLAAMENVSVPYALVEEQLTPVRWYNLDNVGACGAVISSAHDLAHWLRFRLNQGAWHGERLLSEAAFTKIHTPQNTIPFGGDDDETILPYTTHQFYGLGVVIHDIKGKWVYEHGGNMDGQSSRIGVIPELGLGVAVLTNIDSTLFQRALLYTVYDLYLGGESLDWSQRYLSHVEQNKQEDQEREAERKANRATETSPSLPLAQYAGLYEHPLYGRVTIEHEEDGLVFRYNDMGWYVGDLRHWHHDTFDAVMRYRYLGEWTLNFELNSAGEPASVYLDNLEVSFQRVDP